MDDPDAEKAVAAAAGAPALLSRATHSLLHARAVRKRWGRERRAVGARAGGRGGRRTQGAALARVTTARHNGVSQRRLDACACARILSARLLHVGAPHHTAVSYTHPEPTRRS
eukprot:347302-Prymnesium_polylepis.1